MDYYTVLSHAPLAAHMSEETLRHLIDRSQAVHLRGGDYLYRQGQTPDSFYVVVYGRLRVERDGVLEGHVSFGDPVGEAGAITGEARHASVRALRDSVVLQLERNAFLEFLNTHASAAVALARRLTLRLRQTERERQLSFIQQQTTLAILPGTRDAPVMVLAEILTRSLGGYPSVRVITAAHVDAMLGDGAARAAVSDSATMQDFHEWLCRLERCHDHLIFVADNNDSPWALRCLLQADRVLVLAESDTPAKAPPALVEWRHDETPLSPVELVLLRSEGDPSPHTLKWLQATGARAHYYVHPWDKTDLDALKRQISGAGIGLVLGGGGARGFAHIGLLRALEQLEIPVDVCGGTSMGAFMAALVASGYDSVEITQIARETFVDNNYLNDYTWPRVSLIRARKFLRRLHEIFGDQQIEALRRSFYCISTNLSNGAAVVHNTGALAEWVGTSMAVPGVAPPIAWHGDLLCDGGVVNNLPTDVMQNLERGSIVACSVSTEGDISLPGRGLERPEPDALLQKHIRALKKPPRFSEILMRTATLASDTTLAIEAAGRADVFLKMPVQGYGMFSWDALDELVDIGYQEAMRVLTPLRNKLTTGFQPPSKPAPIRVVEPVQ